ncbi:FMN-binding negative transcriptional regulator [Kitasatospora sp. NBC_01287]|uniref:FMN-binding negative transcriptional regulator n=1 Tax=Kitasatospora sp. NBC_01287 TaxID=2903573 RepID=UPI00224FB7F0|nr:FMN-binding negative transcriptional regulator [Kitasatospora sp. NBC_01287]MCX4750801.1 FMN-binding negative transcriptional regulator [Kitasatospora sp. NBC_01287]
MLIRSWDRGSEAEWRDFMVGRDFGVLAANGRGDDGPVLVPTHFALDADRGEILLHLASPNPLFAAIEANPRVTLVVTDDYVFVPGYWQASRTPTSYYAAVQFDCLAEAVDSTAGKAEILNRQLAHFQPETPEVRVVPGAEPYGPRLSGIRGLRLTVGEVRAKFKYDDKVPVEQQSAAAQRLADRAGPGDAGARAQLVRRNRQRGGCPVEQP